MNYVIIKESRDFLYKFKTDFDASYLVNYAKNIHSAHHAKSCWKRGCECRYRFPKKPSVKTHIVENNDVTCNWYRFDGCFDKRAIMGIEEKRNIYDVFSNTYFPPLSNSLLMCNTNVRLLTPGPILMYVSKYVTKSTQKEDSEDFAFMLGKLQKRLLKKKKVTDYSEGMSRILAASFIHNSQNVIGAPLAKYLTTHKSRFQYSHNFVYVPAEDIGALLNKETVKMRVLKSVCGKRFLSNSAYDYIYRPDCLEHLDPVSFYSRYEVIMKRPNSKRETYEFCSDVHPAYKYQVVAMRNVPLIPKLRAYAFIDAKELNGDMFDPTYEITSVAENYAYLILLHFMSYRTIHDLCLNGSYVHLLRERLRSNQLNSDTSKYLQNMQNQRNHFKIHGLKDELESNTNEFVGHGGKKKRSKNAINEDDVEYADFLCSIYDEMDEDRLDVFADDELPTSFTMHPLCRKGFTNSTNVDAANIDLCDNPDPTFIDHVPDELKDSLCSADFVSVVGSENNLQDSNAVIDSGSTRIDGKVTKFSLVSLAGRNCRRRIETNLLTTEQVIPNGSAESIISWSEQQLIDEDGKPCILDDGQRAAFQCMTSAFILTYYKDAEKGFGIGSDEDISNDLANRVAFELNMKNLNLLANGTKDQLIKFFSGQGGSGKSECIRQTILYC